MASKIPLSFKIIDERPIDTSHNLELKNCNSSWIPVFQEFEKFQNLFAENAFRQDAGNAEDLQNYHFNNLHYYLDQFSRLFCANMDELAQVGLSKTKKFTRDIGSIRNSINKNRIIFTQKALPVIDALRKIYKLSQFELFEHQIRSKDKQAITEYEELIQGIKKTADKVDHLLAILVDVRRERFQILFNEIIKKANGGCLPAKGPLTPEQLADKLGAGHNPDLDLVLKKMEKLSKKLHQDQRCRKKELELIRKVATSKKIKVDANIQIGQVNSHKIEKEVPHNEAFKLVVERSSIPMDELSKEKELKKVSSPASRFWQSATKIPFVNIHLSNLIYWINRRTHEVFLPLEESQLLSIEHLFREVLYQNLNDFRRDNKSDLDELLSKIKEDIRIGFSGFIEKSNAQAAKDWGKPPKGIIKQVSSFIPLTESVAKYAEQENQKLLNSLCDDPEENPSVRLVSIKQENAIFKALDQWIWFIGADWLKSLFPQSSIDGNLLSSSKLRNSEFETLLAHLEVLLIKNNDLFLRKEDLSASSHAFRGILQQNVAKIRRKFRKGELDKFSFHDDFKEKIRKEFRDYIHIACELKVCMPSVNRNTIRHKFSYILETFDIFLDLHEEKLEKILPSELQPIDWEAEITSILSATEDIAGGYGIENHSEALAHLEDFYARLREFDGDNEAFGTLKVAMAAKLYPYFSQLLALSSESKLVLTKNDLKIIGFMTFYLFGVGDDSDVNDKINEEYCKIFKFYTERSLDSYFNFKEYVYE